jgi:hypothetical protein
MEFPDLSTSCSCIVFNVASKMGMESKGLLHNEIDKLTQKYFVNEKMLPFSEALRLKKRPLMQVLINMGPIKKLCLESVVWSKDSKVPFCPSSINLK